MNILSRLFASHKYVNPDYYMHSVHPPFTNGAMEYGFVKKFIDPFFIHTGTGYIPSLAWMVEQPPQVYASMTIPSAYVGGVTAGAPLWQTGLSNTDLSTVTDETTGADEGPVIAL